MTPESILAETALFSAVHARRYAEDDASAPWLVISSVLMVQQAATLALRAAGDSIPAQVGATELALRAASRDRLPSPFTLPFGAAARQGFDRLVEARNTFMHPRGLSWFVSKDTLSRGLPVATSSVRHLLHTQPVLEDLVSPEQWESIAGGLEELESLAEFLSDA